MLVIQLQKRSHALVLSPWRRTVVMVTMIPLIKRFDSRLARMSQAGVIYILTAIFSFVKLD